LGGGKVEAKYKSKKLLAIFLIFMIGASLLNGCSRKTGAQVSEKLELAVKYLAEQKYEEAILAYQEVIKIDSKNVTAYKGISLAYTLQEKPDQVEQALQDGLKAIPQNAQLQLAMAGLMLDRGKNEQAEAIYKELVGGTSPLLPSYQAYTNS
jgi:Tfp pilus assembly protein PilF